jgi:AraC-like DNA-binding protein
MPATRELVRAYMFEDHIAVLAEHHLGETHKHGVIQLSISLDDRPHWLGPSDARQRPGRIMLVGSNTIHSFRCEGVTIVYWISPDSRIGAQLVQNYLRDGDIAAVPEEALADLPLAPLRQALDERWDGARFRPVSRALLARLSNNLPAAPQAVHPAIRKAVRIIRSAPHKRIAARDLAIQVGLSESRLLHLFKDHMGMPLRAHLAWLRLMDGLNAALSGRASLTEAAHLAGFTDAAHFNRIAHQYFAVSPSVVAGEILMEFVAAYDPFEDEPAGC